jgi:CopG-like RHH_1 or ribbon-helix-helix domain, RHH_5
MIDRVRIHDKITIVDGHDLNGDPNAVSRRVGKIRLRTTTGVSLPTALKEVAERQARREFRSLSSLISYALERYLREVGAWTDEESDDTESAP